ncbi:MAG: hypothetical protein WCV93_03920 [Candidatus Shapirobacteria bacterium]|jgi:ribosomal protein L29
MKKSDKIATKDKSIASLLIDIKEQQKKLADARIGFHQGQLRDTSVFKKIGYQIAYFKTLIGQKSKS